MTVQQHKSSQFVESMLWTPESVKQIGLSLEGSSPEVILRWGFENFGPGIVIGEKLTLGNNLADVAAGIRVTLPQFIAMSQRLLRQRDPGMDAFEPDAKFLDKFIA